MALFDYETSPGHFWMLRHGERIDETDAAKEWCGLCRRKICTENPHAPWWNRACLWCHRAS